jgi:hypothetical protein
MTSREIVIKADGKSYLLSLTEYFNRNTGAPESYNINLGGSNKKCLNLMISAAGQEGRLSWVERHVECSIEMDDPRSQQVILLALSIAKSLNGNIRYIHLDDTSHFPCALPEGGSHEVEMKPFHIAFYRATWYEYYFNAQLDAGHEEYEALKANFDNPAMKPATFEFGYNQTLKDELEPLYKSSKTWAEFFAAISVAYGKRKCSVIYQWVKDALYLIFENKAHFENMKWTIDLQNNDKTKPIYFESYEAKWTGGSRRQRQRRQATRKRRLRLQKNKKTAYISMNKVGYIIPQYISAKWNYKKFLRKAI